MVEHCIGLMSGTSLDGVDGVLLGFEGPTPRVRASGSVEIPAVLRDRFLALNRPGWNELHLAQEASHQLVELYAQVVRELLSTTGLTPADVLAVGAHGQTVRHQPPQPGNACAYTLQLNQPARLAELTGITVVADFRSRDIAAGGQGAPLVPAFHREVFGLPGQAVAIANIGGIANVTALTADDRVFGWDTGPGNALMDEWCLLHTGQHYDRDGAWASQGTCNEPLLRSLMDDPYFAQVGIKSTGRDRFHLDWLHGHLSRFAPLPAPDVQATLLQLTARTLIDSMTSMDWGDKTPDTLLVCGGGANNASLMGALRAHGTRLRIETTAAAGWPVMDVEAAAFAWLAHRCMHRLPGNEPQVTGAAGPRILGAIYPA